MSTLVWCLLAESFTTMRYDEMRFQFLFLFYFIFFIYVILFLCFDMFCLFWCFPFFFNVFLGVHGDFLWFLIFFMFFKYCFKMCFLATKGIGNCTHDVLEPAWDTKRGVWSFLIAFGAFELESFSLFIHIFCFNLHCGCQISFTWHSAEFRNAHCDVDRRAKQRLTTTAFITRVLVHLM